MSPPAAAETVPRSRTASRAALVALRVLAPAAFLGAALTARGIAPALAGTFLVLCVAARLLAVPYERERIQLEAAAVLPAVALSGSWQLGTILAATAAVLVLLVERRGRLANADLDEAATVVFSSSAAGIVLDGTAAAAAAPVVALRFGAALLAYAAVRLGVDALRHGASGSLPRARLRGGAARQVLALVLLLPTTALVLLVHPVWGLPATLLAFSSVGLVSVALRSLARVRLRAEQLARQTRELTTLRRVSSLLAGPDRDEEIQPRFAQLLRATYPVRAAAVVWFPEQGESAPVARLDGEASIALPALVAWAVARRSWERPAVASGRLPEAHSGGGRDLRLAPGLSHQLLLPLQTPSRSSGVVVLESADSELVEPETMRELSVVADHLALALQDRDLRRRMQAANERLASRAATLQRILQVGNELKAHLSVDRVLASTVEAVHRSLGWRVVLLSLLDRTEDVLERRAQVGLDEAWQELANERVARDEVERWFAERFRVSKSYLVPGRDRYLAEPSGPGATAARRGGNGLWHPGDLLFVPLTSSEKLVGVLSVGGPASGRLPDLEEVQALEIFANQAVTAFQSARAYETTRLMSVRDSLTAAFNHRYFQETLYRELTRHERTSHPVSVAMIDIDDFKKANDRWGHPTGDLILKGLVEELLKGVREMDTVARYGGEEFALILPETPPEKARVVADRLRARIASRVFLSPEVSHPISVTISVGVATFPADAPSKRTLIERADQALYQAKRSGKNCVVAASALNEPKPARPAAAPAGR